MTGSGRAGFTIAEVLVAVVILVIGLMALAGSAAVTTRMIGRGKMGTRAVQVASARLEQLRQAASSTSPPCSSSSFAGGTAVTDGITENWTVDKSVVPARIADTVRYRTTRGVRIEVLTGKVAC